MKNMEMSHQTNESKSTNVEATTSCQHFGNALLDAVLILEGNKLIVDFMGYEYLGWNDKRHRCGHYTSGYYGKKNAGRHSLKIPNSMLFNPLQYHSSWDWLMPVIDKIIKIDITPVPHWTGYRVEIVPRGYVKISGFPMPSITTNVSIQGSLISATWLAVVRFIKWQNENTPKV